MLGVLDKEHYSQISILSHAWERFHQQGIHLLLNYELILATSAPMELAIAESSECSSRSVT